MTQVTLDQAMQIAVQHHQAGRLQEAEQLYRQILAQQPKHVFAMHNLGLIAHQMGRNEIAIDLIRRAIALRPNYPEAHYNLGAALQDNGQLDDAIAAYQRAIALRPNAPEVYSRLGNALKDKGQHDEAIVAYRQAIALRPSDPNAHSNLGTALNDKGQLDEAIAAYRRAIALKPDLPEAHSNLGNALAGKGQLDEAIAACRQAIALRPNLPEAHSNLGNALKDKGRLDEAIAAYRQAIALRPNYPEAHNNLGNALIDKGQIDEALTACRRAIALQPKYADAHNNLGSALKENGQLAEATATYRQAIALRPNYPEALTNLANLFRDNGQLDEAVVAYRQAIALKPNLPEAHSNLANALKEKGLLDEAITSYRQAIALRPNLPVVHSNLVFSLHYDPLYDAAKIYEEHRRWNDVHAQPLAKLIRSHTNRPEAERRLKVGYMSPDFSGHAMSRFLIPVIELHDRSRVEVFCYANVRRPDETTGRFHQLADAWRSIVGVSDEQVAEQVRQDRIDILVDLAMHTSGNRLLVFARKPAPVQATWLAYPGATGMDAIDYRLTDRFLEPPGTADDFNAESSFRLPGCWYCYRPLGAGPSVSALPAPQVGRLTFGCLNNFCKVSAQALACWCVLMRDVPHSRLLIHARPGSHRQAARELLNREGINPDRLSFIDRLPPHEYLRLYHQIDIGLDPFPYSGGTTSCDALWMGVPVVTLSGRTAVGRGTATILHNIGLAELVADSQERYVQIAKELAVDIPRLSQMRSGLRQRMQASPLMDEVGFTRNLESAYRQMWRRWCHDRIAQS